MRRPSSAIVKMPRSAIARRRFHLTVTNLPPVQLDQSGCRLLREQVPKIVVQLTVALRGAQVFMPQLVLHEHERIAHALSAEILVESGSVGATESVRREVVLNW
jgi:hypothetical protein